ncbi:MAG: hypothetical protein J5747_01510 [Spirochaetaceae bacterium]|nr:hypothetical protein [Spirochaetaceae bacterium]
MNENVTKALAVIDREEQKGALSFVTREDFMGVTPLYKPEVTVIQLRLPQKQWDNDADVYEISGKYMPKREIVDRIGEATGLVFLRDGCRTWSELREDDIAGKRTVYVSEQQAKKRMSDGSFRTSSVNVYEFDPVLRAMVDYNVTELNAQTKMQKNRTGKTLAQTILEYTKVARQRAETGARLRVIRELTNMPTAFSKEDAAKPLVFGRIAQNTNYILQTPEGRAMASAQALGVDVASLFGGRKLPQPEETSAQSVTENGPETALPATTAEISEYEDVPGQNAEFSCDAPEEPQNAAPAAEQDADDSKPDSFEILTQALEEWVESYKDILNVKLASGMNPYTLARDELDSNNFNASVESRKAMIQRIKDFLKIKGVKI